jgi:hypothetical protein
MGLWGDIKDYGSSTYDALDRTMGGLLPGGVDPGDPARSGGEYSGVDRGNFDLPGYQATQDRYGNYLNQVDRRDAPTINQNTQFRGGQTQLSNLLMDRAQGRGSVAEQQMQQGVDLANQRQLALAAGARPGNAAMAFRMAGQNMGSNMMDLAGQTAIARAAEANQAANSLGGVLAQGRGADDQLAMAQAQMQQNQMGINDAARQGLLGGSLAASQAQQQGGQNYEQNRTQRFGSVMGAPTNEEVLMGGLQGVAKGAMMGG